LGTPVVDHDKFSILSRQKEAFHNENAAPGAPAPMAALKILNWNQRAGTCRAKQRQYMPTTVFFQTSV
jgi:hypothetical protein